MKAMETEKSSWVLGKNGVKDEMRYKGKEEFVITLGSLSFINEQKSN